MKFEIVKHLFSRPRSFFGTHYENLKISLRAYKNEILLLPKWCVTDNIFVTTFKYHEFIIL